VSENVIGNDEFVYSDADEGFGDARTVESEKLQVKSLSDFAVDEGPLMADLRPECEGFGHCMRILILRVLHATHAVPIPDEILDNNSDIIIHIDRSVQHMLHNVKGFELQVGGVSDRELLAEYDWKDNTIRLQGGWIAEMNHMLDSLQNPKSNHSSAEREVLESSLKWHKTLVIIKIIHEYMHALTPRIMEFDYDVRTETGVGSVHGTNDRQYISLNNAPALVGSQMACGMKHSRYIGDMGSAMEEFCLAMVFVSTPNSREVEPHLYSKKLYSLELSHRIPSIRAANKF
jgi:hypothetical protein